MLPLDKTLRNRLEKSIKDARDIAEDAALAALNQLGVKESKPFDYLTPEERGLRRRLRAHGRQLGDTRDSSTKAQKIDRLVEEVAYEQWHRMLFARFLAENNLLMYPDPDEPIAVTLEECDDLASEEGAQNGWELAAKFAAKMLPQIFRPDSPAFELVLPPEHEQKLEQLAADLEPEVFTASDSLGWVYQFWQAKRKEEVNKSEVKIGARELPAVTQLFTEPYMVSFLLDNSLGAWWAGHRLTPEDYKKADSEDELREKAALDGVPLAYLRFVKEDEAWTPAAGTFDAWPEKLSELKTLDPCCGSGHFLVAAFLMLVPMRMELEGLSAKEAVDAVLNENINGLEIDKRCVELAAFALALTAWRYPDAGGYRPLPELNLACSGLSISSKKDEWVGLAGDNPDLKIALGELYEQFKDAPVLGSLINPESSLKKDSLFEIEWEEVNGLLEQALSGEQSVAISEMGVVAKGISKAASILSSRYDFILTNVPYLVRGKQGTILRNFCEQNYNQGKNDLATVFLDRCLEFCDKWGTINVVLPQNWLFLTSYKKFRKKLLKNYNWHFLAKLGPGAFETISGEVVKGILLNISCGIVEETGSDNIFEKCICGLDVSESSNVAQKSEQLISSTIQMVEQDKQIENPDARITLSDTELGNLLREYAYSYHGLTSGDMPRMKFLFWEILNKKNIWIPFQGTVKKSVLFGGNEGLLRWEDEQGAISELKGARKDGTEAWGKKGVLVSQMQQLPVTLYNHSAFDNNTAAIVPNDDESLIAVWCFCSSPEYNKAVRRLDQKLSVTSATLAKVPFDIDHWTKVANNKYPNGLPKPYSDDPTQWIFHGHPAQSDDPLQVAMARLLGYRWPAELDKDMELSQDARSWVDACEDLLDLADQDGIVCIPAVRGEMKAEDRLGKLLARAFGSDWDLTKKNELLAGAGHGGKSLESWLRDKFFVQHCKLFHHRPFIWHVWDGLNDGFAAFVNYHKLDNKLLETLIYTYLGDWISQQHKNADRQVDGAQEKLAAAQNLKAKLELILEGEAPHDIFVRWKSIEDQACGWHPDLNDGVRLNIRPFMTVGDVKKKGAGVLRDKPNIKWGKDRGKDVETAPWYPVFKGDRINDHHLSLADKKAARDKAKEMS